MSDEKHPNLVARGFGRRSLLSFAIAAPFLCFSRKSSANLSPVSRRLNIHNQVGGEFFNDVYFEDGQYITEAMTRLNYVMRDHNGSVIQMDPDLFDLLDNLTRTMSPRGPIELISGYRTPESNSAARRQSRRVARNSLHMQGRAADIMMPGYGTRELRRAAISLQAGGVGTYRRSRFVHVDTGPVRAW